MFGSPAGWVSCLNSALYTKKAESRSHLPQNPPHLRLGALLFGRSVTDLHSSRMVAPYRDVALAVACATARRLDPEAPQCWYKILAALSPNEWATT
jgi:hypothetical protein